MLIRDLEQLVQHRELLVAWITRELKARYKQTTLGIVWAVVQPLSLMLIFTLVFGIFVRVPMQDGLPYPLFSYAGLLAWTFTATSLSLGVTSLTRNMHVLTTVYFPREILPIAVVAASLADFALASMVFVGLLIAYHIAINPYVLLIPVILLVQILLTVGITLWASATNVFWRDARFVVPLALQIWFYASPIVYPIHLVPQKFYPFYILNPMVGIVEGYRATVLRATPPDWITLGIAALAAIVLFVSGYAYFKHGETQFADTV
jgi:lipopolysaccharide transport system permease protein